MDAVPEKISKSTASIVKDIHHKEEQVEVMPPFTHTHTHTHTHQVAELTKEWASKWKDIQQIMEVCVCVCMRV